MHKKYKSVRGAKAMKASNRKTVYDGTNDNDDETQTGNTEKFRTPDAVGLQNCHFPTFLKNNHAWFALQLDNDFTTFLFFQYTDLILRW